MVIKSQISDSSKKKNSKNNLEINFEETPLDIKFYNSEKELEIAEEDLFNEIKGNSSSRNQSQYSHRGGSKAGNTELRIAGVIINLLKASELHSGGCKARIQIADIARQLMTNGKGVSNRTISRYLTTVLNKMQVIYGIHFEVIVGAKGGYRIWTKEHQEKLESGEKREFDESLFERTNRKNDKSRIHKWKNYHDKKKQAKKMAKGSNNLTSRKPVKLAGLARKISQKTNLNEYSNIQITATTIFFITWNLLTSGHWQNDILNIVNKALHITNAATSDFNIRSQNGYLKGVIKNLSKGIKKPTKEQINIKRFIFWNQEKEKSDEFIKENEGVLSVESVQMTNLYFEGKINTCFK